MTIPDVWPLPDEGQNPYIAKPYDVILVTGASGFIGSKVVRTLINYGYKRVRCLIRPTSNLDLLQTLNKKSSQKSIKIIRGNLLSKEDCIAATAETKIIYHLAVGSESTFAGCFLNSVVTTKNLLDAVNKHKILRRFVNTSSIAVYSTKKIRRSGSVDESCEVDNNLVERFDPYAYGKAKQDEIVLEYAKRMDLPYVIVRPGVVFGPGKAFIPGRVGTDTFGVFLHLGLNNKVPLTYVNNCAEAIVLAGLKENINGEIINIVDDDLPMSKEFLSMYKRRVHRFTSIPIPYPVFYFLSYLWEQYSNRSEGQLPPVFNRNKCTAYFKAKSYSNKKAKELLGWYPKVKMGEALKNYFNYMRELKGIK